MKIEKFLKRLKEFDRHLVSMKFHYDPTQSFDAQLDDTRSYFNHTANGTKIYKDYYTIRCQHPKELQILSKHLTNQQHFVHYTGPDFITIENALSPTIQSIENDKENTEAKPINKKVFSYFKRRLEDLHHSFFSRFLPAIKNKNTHKYNTLSFSKRLSESIKYNLAHTFKPIFTFATEYAPVPLIVLVKLTSVLEDNFQLPCTSLRIPVLFNLHLFGIKLTNHPEGNSEGNFLTLEWMVEEIPMGLLSTPFSVLAFSIYYSTLLLSTLLSIVTIPFVAGYTTVSTLIKHNSKLESNDRLLSNCQAIVDQSYDEIQSMSIENSSARKAYLRICIPEDSPSYRNNQLTGRNTNTPCGFATPIDIRQNIAKEYIQSECPWTDENSAECLLNYAENDYQLFKQRLDIENDSVIPISNEASSQGVLQASQF